MCSECAEEGHIFRECPNKANPKCVICGENHTTLSSRCKTRKDIIWKIEHEKTTKEREQNAIPYSTVARRASDASLKEASASNQIINLPNEFSFKVLVIIINAHLANIGRPGTYTQEVKKGLRAANLPEVQVPNHVNSVDTFQVIPPPQPTESQMTTQQTERTPLQPSGEQLSVRPKARHPSISMASTTSE